MELDGFLDLLSSLISPSSSLVARNRIIDEYETEDDFGNADNELDSSVSDDAHHALPRQTFSDSGNI